MAISKAQINSIKDFTLRTILLGMYDQHVTVGTALGINILEPTNSPQEAASKPPPLAALTVAGANGAFNWSIANPSQSVNKTIYHELSYSSQQSFVGGSGISTLSVSSATKDVTPAPGVTAYWRIRSSYDQHNWNSYQTLGPFSAGLQSSAASEAATVLNQTNYANVDSAQNSTDTGAIVRVYGKSGLNTQYPSVKGSAETILPSATIINVPFATEQVVGFDGSNYQVRGTLPEVLQDASTPIGAVSVVGSGARVLPVVTVTIAGGLVTSWNVVSGGNDLSDPVTLTPPVEVGAGGAPGAQTITTGVLISIANGTPGAGGTDGTYPVGVSGGIAAGSTGGGRGIGGNGGRLVVNDGTIGA